MSAGQLATSFNTPTLNDRGLFLTAHDLSTNFPRLYVPMDFVRLTIDWSACGALTDVDGYFPRIPKIVPHVAEFKPSPLASSIAPHIQQDRPPRGTQLEPDVQNSYSARALPIKYNCRVIMSLGLNEEEPGSKFCIARRLRLLIGRRKGNTCLLGGAWSQELDGGDPRSDDSCLVNTARRCVRALSFCDLDRCGVLTKLMEVTYRRPEESIGGKSYPEQEERTFIYLATIHAPHYSEQDFSQEWELFVRRCRGLDMGPRLSPASTLMEESHNSLEGTDRDSGVAELKTDEPSNPSNADESSSLPHTEYEMSTQCESQHFEPSIAIDDSSGSLDDSHSGSAEPETHEIGTEGSETQCDITSVEPKSAPTPSTETKSLLEMPQEPKILICPQVGLRNSFNQVHNVQIAAP